MTTLSFRVKVKCPGNLPGCSVNENKTIYVKCESRGFSGEAKEHFPGEPLFQKGSLNKGQSQDLREISAVIQSGEKGRIDL